MCIERYLTPFLFALLLFGTIELLPQQVLALPHCGCGYCYMAATGRCTCSIPPGWCLEDSYASQFRPSPDTRPTEAISDVADLISILTPSDVTKTVMSLVSGGECLHKKVTLNLLRNVGDTLELVPARFKDNI